MMWFYGIQSLTIEIEIKSADWEKQKPHTRNNNEIQLGQKLLQCSHQIGAHRMGSVLVNSTFSLSFPTLRLLSATIEREICFECDFIVLTVTQQFSKQFESEYANQFQLIYR